MKLSTLALKSKHINWLQANPVRIWNLSFYFQKNYFHWCNPTGSTASSLPSSEQQNRTLRIREWFFVPLSLMMDSGIFYRNGHCEMWEITSKRNMWFIPMFQLKTSTTQQVPSLGVSDIQANLFFSISDCRLRGDSFWHYSKMK